MQRKHQVVVEVTFPEALPAKTAKYLVQEVIEQADTEQILGGLPQADRYNASFDKVVCKQGERVLTGRTEAAQREIARLRALLSRSIAEGADREWPRVVQTALSE